MQVFLLFAWIGFQLCAAFQNPIIPGFNPDPSITRVGEDYFLVTSSFEYFPGVPVYHSKNLIKWDIIGHALNRPSQLNMRGTAPSGGIFAPTLRYHEASRTFYMITTWFDIISPPDTTRMPRSFYVKTKNIFDDDSWSDPTYVDVAGFDPDLFFDPDGSVHLTTTTGATHIDPNAGYFSIFHTEIDLATGNSLSDTSLLHISTLPLDTPRLAEASHIFKLNGYYYLFTAEAGTENGHREMVKRAKSLKGPWEENPENPILFNGRNMSNPILATGHADLVSTPSGDWYLVFLATRPQNPPNSNGRPQLGRETFLAPVKWVNGWPVVNNNKDITLSMPGLYDLARPKKWREEFRGGMDRAWYTLRTPYKRFWEVRGKTGLRLTANPYLLSDRETPAALLRKQVDLSTVWSTEVSFNPTAPSQEAGITIFLSLHYYNTIGVALHPDTLKPCIVATTRSGPEGTVNTTYHALKPQHGSNKVRLFIKATPEEYALGYSEGSGDIVAAKVSSRWLQAFLSGWQVFTGSFFGLYVQGVGGRTKADFAYAQTELLK